MNNAIIKLKELPDGNLRIELDNTEEAREAVRELNERMGDSEVWSELLEPTSCNGGYSLLQPEWIGALTDSPIIGSEPAYYEDSSKGLTSRYPKIDKDTKVWYFPDYMVRSELGELLEKGFVIFVKAD